MRFKGPVFSRCGFPHVCAGNHTYKLKYFKNNISAVWVVMFSYEYDLLAYLRN